MVRLKGKNRQMFLTHHRLFQFHYGTIKSQKDLFHGLMPNAFQFHYGTIKRFEPVVQWLRRLHFNSTMVRLKVDTRFIPSRYRRISIPLWYD